MEWLILVVVIFIMFCLNCSLRNAVVTNNNNNMKELEMYEHLTKVRAHTQMLEFSMSVLKDRGATGEEILAAIEAYHNDGKYNTAILRDWPVKAEQ